MINITKFDDDGSAEDLDDAAKLRLLARYFAIQDQVAGSDAEPQIQQDLERIADRMEDLEAIAAWWRTSNDALASAAAATVLDRIAAEGAIK